MYKQRDTDDPDNWLGLNLPTPKIFVWSLSLKHFWLLTFQNSFSPVWIYPSTEFFIFYLKHSILISYISPNPPCPSSNPQILPQNMIHMQMMQNLLIVSIQNFPFIWEFTFHPFSFFPNHPNFLIKGLKWVILAELSNMKLVGWI